MDTGVIDLKILGGIFKHYRNIGGFTREDLSFDVVSASTVQRIENGVPIKNISFYEKFANKLGWNFLSDENPYIELSELIRSFINSINKVPYKRLLQLEEKIKDFNIKYQEYIYINELSLLPITALKIYIDNFDIDISYIDLIKDIYPYLIGDLKIISDYILYKLSLEYYYNEEFKKYSTYGKNIQNKSIFFFDKIYYDINNYNLVEIYEKYKNELNSNIKNKMELFSIYSNLACCELNLDRYENAYSHLKSALEIEDIRDYLPDTVYLKSIKRFGIINFYTSKHQDAIKCFEYVRKQSPLVLDFNYIFLFNSLEKIGANNLILDIIENDKQYIKSSILKNVFNYYKEKHTTNDINILEDIICEKLTMEKLVSKIYYDIFLEDLKNIVKINNHYKKLYIYTENNI